METPTIEEVKAYYKYAKKIKGNYKEFNISKVINTLRKCGDVFEVVLGCGYIAHVWENGNYKEIISYTEPTVEVRNSVLLQLADNNSFSEKLIRKEFPQVFSPTDIITIVEKYGKDKVISLIEKM